MASLGDHDELALEPRHLARQRLERVEGHQMLEALTRHETVLLIVRTSYSQACRTFW